MKEKEPNQSLISVRVDKDFPQVLLKSLIFAFAQLQNAPV